MARRRKRHRPVCVADMVFKGGQSVETSGFSGAPAGDEAQPPAELGFFVPVPDEADAADVTEDATVPAVATDVAGRRRARFVRTVRCRPHIRPHCLHAGWVTVAPGP